MRCRALAQQLLSKGELAEEERVKVKALLHKLRDDDPISDVARDFLNNLAVRYL